MDGGVLWRNGYDGKVLRCGVGERHQHTDMYRYMGFPEPSHQHHNRNLTPSPTTDYRTRKFPYYIAVLLILINNIR